MATKFREWLDEVQRLKVEISEVSESLYADGHSITVHVRDRVYAAVDGTECDARYLRPYFTHHKDDFLAMLEALSDRCKAIAETTELAQNIAAYDAIPGAVIDRLKGEDTGDTADLVRRSAEKRLADLMTVAKKIDPIFSEVDFEFPPFGDYPMGLEKGHRGIAFRWGGFKIWNKGQTQVSSNLQEQLMFLGNFDVIKARLEQFVSVVEELKNIGR